MTFPISHPCTNLCFCHIYNLCVSCHCDNNEEGYDTLLDRAAGALQTYLSVEDRWEIFLCDCPSTGLLLVAVSQCVKQDMCHHFSSVCWWLILNQGFHPAQNTGQENKAIVGSLTFLFLLESKSNCVAFEHRSCVICVMDLTAWSHDGPVFSAICAKKTACVASVVIFLESPTITIGFSGVSLDSWLNFEWCLAHFKGLGL